MNASTGEKKNAEIFSGWKAWRKKDGLGGTCHIWDDNIEMDVKGMIFLGLDSILLELYGENKRTFVKMAMNSWIL